MEYLSATCNVLSHGRAPYTSIFNTTVEKQCHSLKMLKFLGVNPRSQEFVDAFNTRWGDLLPIGELILEGSGGSNVLATPISIAWTQPLYPADLQQHLGDAGAWGQRLERARIDYIPLVKLETEYSSKSAYSNLKILMLQPLGAEIGGLTEAPTRKCRSLNVMTWHTTF